MKEGMKKVILKQLEDIEGKYGVKILLAVDGGSRGYGIASPHSDYDIRFIYVRPAADYLRVVNRLPDTISETHFDNLDFHGWDLSKVSDLAASGNVKLWDMLMAKEAYIRQNDFVQAAIKFCNVFQHPRLVQAYIRRAQEYIEMCKGESTINAKCALHAAVAALQGHWLVHKNTIPPTHLSDLWWEETPEWLSLVKPLAHSRAQGAIISAERSFAERMTFMLIELHSAASMKLPHYKRHTDEVAEHVNKFFITWQALGNSPEDTGFC